MQQKNQDIDYFSYSKQQIEEYKNQLVKQEGINNYDELNIILDREFKLSTLNQPVVMIRHALSEFNYQIHLIHIEENKENPDQDKINEMWRQLKLDQRYIDSCLHPLGIIQCASQQQYINQMDFQVVFISPMYRVLETVDYLFKTHPRRSEIQFVIIPQLSETMGMSPSVTTDTVEYIQKEKSAGHLNIDDTLLYENHQNPLMWGISQLTNLETKADMMQRLGEKPSKQDYIDILFKKFEEIYPTKLETRVDAMERGAVAKQKMKQYIIENQIDINCGGPKDKKIGIISHAVFFDCMTCKKIENEKCIGGTVPKNAELVGFSSNVIGL